MPRSGSPILRTRTRSGDWRRAPPQRTAEPARRPYSSRSKPESIGRRAGAAGAARGALRGLLRFSAQQLEGLVEDRVLGWFGFVAGLGRCVHGHAWLHSLVVDGLALRREVLRHG